MIFTLNYTLKWSVGLDYKPDTEERRKPVEGIGSKIFRWKIILNQYGLKSELDKLKTLETKKKEID